MVVTTGILAMLVQPVGVGMPAATRAASRAAIAPAHVAKTKGQRCARRPHEKSRIIAAPTQTKFRLPPVPNCARFGKIVLRSLWFVTPSHLAIVAAYCSTPMPGIIWPREKLLVAVRF